MLEKGEIKSSVTWIVFLMAAKLDKIFKYSLLYQPMWGFERFRLCNAPWPTFGRVYGNRHICTKY